MPDPKPRWLPWRDAEMRAEDGTVTPVQIRFLDTREEEAISHVLGQAIARRLGDAGVPMDGAIDDGLIARSVEHLGFHGDGGERETHRRLTDQRIIPDEDGGL